MLRAGKSHLEAREAVRKSLARPMLAVKVCRALSALSFRLMSLWADPGQHLAKTFPKIGNCVADLRPQLLGRRWTAWRGLTKLQKCNTWVMTGSTIATLPDRRKHA